MEEALLEGPRRFDRAEVADLAGVDIVSLTRIWRAMGFPDPPPGSEAFTESDVVAARRIARLVDEGVFDEGFAVGVTRAMGHHLARLVEWQYVAFAEHLAARDGLGADEAGRAAITRLAENLGDFEALMLYVWRRRARGDLHPSAGRQRPRGLAAPSYRRFRRPRLLHASGATVE